MDILMRIIVQQVLVFIRTYVSLDRGVINRITQERLAPGVAVRTNIVMVIYKLRS